MVVKKLLCVLIDILEHILPEITICTTINIRDHIKIFKGPNLNHHVRNVTVMSAFEMSVVSKLQPTRVHCFVTFSSFHPPQRQGYS